MGLCVEKSLEEVTAMMGIMRVGGAYVPLDPKQPTSRLVFITNHCKLSIVLSHQHVVPLIESLRNQVSSGSKSERGRPEPAAER